MVVRRRKCEFATEPDYEMSWRDFKEVGRSLRREPLLRAFVVLLLAVGIGANTLIFTAVNGLLLRLLPVADPEALVRLGVQRSPTLISFDHPYSTRAF
jgi:hypothetical protein